MRRTFGALVSAGVLVTILAGTASAAPSKHAGKASSFVASACVDSQNVMILRVDWANETIDQNQNLTVTWTLQSRRLPATPIVGVFSPTFDETSWANTASDVIVGPKGPVDWNKWRTISATASGAFAAATAKAVRRAGRGWPAC